MRQELQRAGLPVYRGDLSGGPQSRPGVDVHVTPFVDGGVYVDWGTDAEMRDPALDLFAQGIDYWGFSPRRDLRSKNQTGTGAWSE